MSTRKELEDKKCFLHFEATEFDLKSQRLLEEAKALDEEADNLEWQSAGEFLLALDVRKKLAREEEEETEQVEAMLSSLSVG